MIAVSLILGLCLLFELLAVVGSSRGTASSIVLVLLGNGSKLFFGHFLIGFFFPFITVVMLTISILGFCQNFSLWVLVACSLEKWVF